MRLIKEKYFPDQEILTYCFGKLPHWKYIIYCESSELRIPYRLCEEDEEESRFVGKNLTLEEYSSLNEKEKLKLQSDLWKDNKEWIESKFRKLKAAWIAVIDGKVATFSEDIDDFPQRSKILEICEEHNGKFPFIFEDKERFLSIEESSSSWSRVSPDDNYPTAEIQVISLEPKSKSITITADFDTGCGESLYVDMSYLISEGLTSRPYPEDRPEEHKHLNAHFFYYRRNFFLGVVSEMGKVLKAKFSILCVRDWGNSPFVKINKERRALVGRRLFQKLNPSPNVLLKFGDKKTEIY
ncbi:MAG: hypothetical protein AB1422_11700 [bacterium]